MPGSLRLGKIAGIAVYGHVSWLIFLVLLTWSLASDWFAQVFPGWAATTYWIAAFVSALLFFVCVLAHELGHALVARAHGLTVRDITLFVFGGVASIEEESKRPGVELQIALAGPAVSLLLAAFAYLLGLPLKGSGASAQAVLDYLAVTNLLLAIFNLIPGFPLDGGRALRSVIWKVTGNFRKATHIASSVGQTCGYVFILLGIIEFFTGNFFYGLWTAFIGWFLLSASQSAALRVEMQWELQGISVEQVMNPQPTTVPANISLHKLVNEYFIPQELHQAFVTQGEYLAGLITLGDIVAVERDRWIRTPVGHIMRQREQVYSVSPRQPLHEALQVMSTRGLQEVPVVEQERLVGLLSLESILHSLQARRHLQTDERRGAA